MTDQVLDILKLVLLVLLYLFFARVLWAVWSEVRQPADARTATDFAPQQQQPVPAVESPGPPAAQPGRRPAKPAKGRGGVPRRLVMLEPKQRRGTSFAIVAEVGIGRDTHNTIVITDDEYISGRHARVFSADGHVVAEDLASRNGTYLNGALLTQPHTVRSGDRIQVGYTVLEAQ
jgi:pSer/pThr/pTyr-binding forkhead associated (FHA) protein